MLTGRGFVKAQGQGLMFQLSCTLLGTPSLDRTEFLSAGPPTPRYYYPPSPQGSDLGAPGLTSGKKEAAGLPFLAATLPAPI